MKPDSPKPQRRMRRMGYSFMAIACMVLLAAWNTGANILYIIFGGLMSFIVLSFLLCRYSLRKLAVDREVPETVHRGHEALLTLRVTNHKRLIPAVSIRVENLPESSAEEAYIVKIPPQSTAVAHVRHGFPKRGVVPLPPVILRTTFPFGLLESFVYLNDGREVVVYPQVRPIKAPLVHRHESVGSAPKVSRSGGTEFHSLRDYVPGDDTRHIAWRTSARMGSLVVRELEIETARAVSIVLDTHKTPNDPDFEEHFEEAIDAAASLSVKLLQQKYQVALFMPEGDVLAGEGRPHAQRILDILARVEPGPPSMEPYRPTDLAAARTSAIIYISPDPARWKGPSPIPGGRMVNPKEIFRAKA